MIQNASATPPNVKTLDHDAESATHCLATTTKSTRAISPSDFPFRRIEQNKITKSWTHPANAAPAISHNVPGKYPNCAASVGPTSGPGPAIAAKWCPNKTHLFVDTKSRPSSFRSAGVARVSSSATTFAAKNAEYNRYATK